MNKHLLLIAFHFPPLRASSGLQRALKFCQYLPGFGWKSSVLTIDPRAYWITSDDQMGEIPDDTVVLRAKGYDASRQLACKGKYLKWMALPDRWISWYPFALVRGLRFIFHDRPDVLLSTYPIATAHLVAYSLHRLTGIPWVADLRDSMTEDNYPKDKRHRRLLQWIERRVVNNASRVIFTTKGALRMYADRYPNVPRERWTVIANGYDEENFSRAEEKLMKLSKSSLTVNRKLKLLHSGLIYPEERDPSHFFIAIKNLKDARYISNDCLEIVLRASGHDALYQKQINDLNIDDIVKLEPGVTYETALAEMLESDGLILFQAASCNHQIPAKLYEYIRAQRPVFSLTDRKGDTAGVLIEAEQHNIVPLDDSVKIEQGFLKYYQKLVKNNGPLPSKDVIEKYSRRGSTKLLAELLNTI